MQVILGTHTLPIPDYQSLMRPLLAQLEDGSTKSLKQLMAALIQEFGLSEEEQAQRISSGRQTVMKNRVGWARTYLHKAGLLSLPVRAHCQITDRGRQALKQCPERIDNSYLKQFEEFREFTTPKKATIDNTPIAAETSDATPEERLETAYEELNAELASELIDTLKQCSPQFFEQLVVDLMYAMGYGGWSKDSGAATQYTADGGIDGIINEDPLGLEIIYLQAKRYKDATVGRPEVQAFAGALDMKRAKKGVFITVSSFSKDAIEYVGMIEKKIKLIDGQRLAELMIAHNLGVSVKQTYHTKTLDTDYFNED